MTRHRRLPSLTRAAAVAALAVVLVGVPLAPASAVTGTDLPDLSGLDYVALGDSYSAGYGIEPYSFTNPADGCFQADENYPKQVAAALGLTLDDRTCSGAVTANIIDTPQLTITGEGTAPVQSLALTADTDLVTVTIGGNDLGFSDVAAFCVALSPEGPVLGDPRVDNCSDFFNPEPGIDQLLYKLENTVTPALANTFADIVEKAPNAQIIVVGYPAIAPNAANVPQGGCFSPAVTSDGPPYPENAFPYTAKDTTYLHNTEGELDSAIREQAEAIGATYISTVSDTDAHSACQTDGSAYVNGLTILFQEPGTHVGGTPTPDPLLFVKYGALHPNAAGVGYLTSRVSTVAETLLAPEPGVGDPSATPTPSPTPSVAAPGTPPAADAASLAATGIQAWSTVTLAAALLGAGAISFAAVRRAGRDRARTHR